MPGEDEKSGISRREFLRDAAIGLTGLGLVACAPKIPDTDSTNTEEKETISKINLGEIASYDISVQPDSLGAVDSRNPNISYSRAIKDGGLITIGGADIKTNYNGGVFNGDVTFLNSPESDGRLRVGDIIPRAYMFKPETGTKYAVTLINYAMRLHDTQSVDVLLNEETEYCLIPIVTTGVPTSITDPGNTIPEGFSINSDNMVGADKGWLSWALLQVSKEKNSDGTWGMQVMGVVENKSSSGIYIDPNSAPNLSAYEG